MNNSTHLFLFTIGPVQSFIAQARKTQDLYAGSAILSELIKTAIDEVGRDKVIFPFSYPNNAQEWEKLDSLPNRFIALIEKQEKLKDFGKNIECKVRSKWMEIALNAAEECLKCNQEEDAVFTLKNAFLQQISQHLEIFWLFEPINDDYKRAYRNIERNLGAIKNVRSFKQFTYNGIGEKGRKCSLDGERNALFFGRGTNQNYFGSNSKWNPDACLLNGIPNVKIAANEGLSAVSFTKRFYNTGGFPSTAEIALQNIESNGLIKSKIDYLKGIFKNDFDYQLLYDENLTEEYFKKNGLDEQLLSGAKETFLKIRKLAKENELKMNSYYALLSFDGDSMGEWLSKAVSLEQHQKFSELLINFAQKASEIVNKNGKTVYAGGDDFLGFVNLQGLFETIEELKTTFNIEVTKNVPIENGSKEFTMSMGVVIAHYKMPLRKVIQLNREILKETKERFKQPINDYAKSKNGIGFCYTTSSTILGKTYLNDLQDLQTLSILTNHFIEGNISPNILVKYFQSIQSIIGNELSFDAYLSQLNILSVELLRLLKRSSKGDTFKDLGLVSFLKKQSKEYKPNEWTIDTDNFLSFIKIAAKLSPNYSKPINNEIPTT